MKKNSILQVDYTNVLRRQGMPLREALVQASETRLRPILMTTAAIVAGLIPTALGVGAGAAQRADIAVTIVGGQSLCLFLTLLLVPVSYSLAEEAAERAKNFRRARADRTRRDFRLKAEATGSQVTTDSAHFLVASAFRRNPSEQDTSGARRWHPRADAAARRC